MTASTAILMVLAAVGAGLGIRLAGRTPLAMSLWWVAAATAAAGALAVSARSPVPVAASASAAGLTAAAVIDAVEGLVPTALARWAAVATWVSLAGHGLVGGAWADVVRATLLTTLLVVGLLVVWLAGGIGFGDVRLAVTAGSAMTAGVPGLVVLVAAAFAVAAALVAARRARGGPRGWSPFGPALAVGWLVATCAV